MSDLTTLGFALLLGAWGVLFVIVLCLPHGLPSFFRDKE
jgi:hypothetical protein